MAASQIPPVRTREPFACQARFEQALPLDEIALVVKRFDAFRSIHGDDAQLVDTDGSLPRLVPDVVVAALEPPEHTVSDLSVDRDDRQRAAKNAGRWAGDHRGSIADE